MMMIIECNLFTCLAVLGLAVVFYIVYSFKQHKSYLKKRKELLKHIENGDYEIDEIEIDL